MRFGLLQIGLLFWQIIGIWFIVNDGTLSPPLKAFGVILNSVFFLFILVQIMYQPINILTFGIGIGLFMWYIYYTPIDFNNPGYTPFQRFCYVAIDLCSLIYLIYTISTMTVILYNNYNQSHNNNIDLIKRILVG